MSDRLWTWIEIACTVVVPTALLVFGGGWFSPKVGLVVALAFPLGFAVASLAREGRPSGLAVLSLVSVVVSGGVGLLELDTRWFAYKEAVIPVLFGLVFAATAATPRPAVGLVLERVLDPERTVRALDRTGQADRYAALARRATVELAAVTAASGLASCGLARWMVVAPAGTEAFSQELGRYTGASFVVVTVPVMAASVWVLMRAMRQLEDALGEPIDGLLRTASPTERPAPEPPASDPPPPG